MSVHGPSLSSPASAWNGSYLGISCHLWGRRTTAEDDPKLPSAASQFRNAPLRRRERKPHLIRREIVFREWECGKRRVSGFAEKLFCAYPN